MHGENRPFLSHIFQAGVLHCATAAAHLQACQRCDHPKPCIVATPDMRGILGSDDGEGEHRGSQAMLSAGLDASAGANQIDTARQALPQIMVVHPQRCSPSKSFVSWEVHQSPFARTPRPSPACMLITDSPRVIEWLSEDCLDNYWCAQRQCGGHDHRTRAR